MFPRSKIYNTVGLLVLLVFEDLDAINNAGFASTTELERFRVHISGEWRLNNDVPCFQRRLGCKMWEKVIFSK